MSNGLTQSAAAASLFLVLGILMVGCAGPERSAVSADGPSDGDEQCLTDLTSPSATLEVETADLDLQEPALTADVAVVQVDHGDAGPRVLGQNATLARALEGSRVWGVVGNGLLVENRSADSDRSAQLSIIDSAGRTTLEGPRFSAISRVQVIGDQFLVDDRGRISAHDVATGAKVDQQYLEPAATRRSIASSIIVTSDGVIDARSGKEFDFDQLLDEGGHEGTYVESTGSDRVLIESEDGDNGSRFWTWSAAEGPREVSRFDDVRTLGDLASPGICGHYLYLAERDELRVFDTRSGAVVTTRGPFGIKGATNSAYDVLAIPGSVLVVDADATRGSTRYAWFDD